MSKQALASLKTMTTLCCSPLRRSSTATVATELLISQRRVPRLMPTVVAASAESLGPGHDRRRRRHRHARHVRPGRRRRRHARHVRPGRRRRHHRRRHRARHVRPDRRRRRHAHHVRPGRRRRHRGRHQPRLVQRTEALCARRSSSKAASSLSTSRRAAPSVRALPLLLGKVFKRKTSRCRCRHHPEGAGYSQEGSQSMQRSEQQTRRKRVAWRTPSRPRTTRR